MNDLELPDLPWEKTFWRVHTYSSFGIPYVEVQLRRRGWLGSSEVRSRRSFLEDPEQIPLKIVALAELIMEDSYSKDKEWQAYDKSRRYDGDYGSTDEFV